MDNVPSRESNVKRLLMTMTVMVLAIVEVDRLASWIVNVTTSVMNRDGSACDGKIGCRMGRSMGYHYAHNGDGYRRR